MLALSLNNRNNKVSYKSTASSVVNSQTRAFQNQRLQASSQTKHGERQTLSLSNRHLTVELR